MWLDLDTAILLNRRNSGPVSNWAGLTMWSLFYYFSPSWVYQHFFLHYKLSHGFWVKEKAESTNPKLGLGPNMALGLKKFVEIQQWTDKNLVITI